MLKTIILIAKNRLSLKNHTKHKYFVYSKVKQRYRHCEESFSSKLRKKESFKFIQKTICKNDRYIENLLEIG